MKRENVIKVLGYGYFKTTITRTSESTTVQCNPMYRKVALCEIVRVIGSDTVDVYNLNDELLADLEKHFNVDRNEMIPLMSVFSYDVNENESPFFDAVENAIGSIKRGKFNIRDCGNR